MLLATGCSAAADAASTVPGEDAGAAATTGSTGGAPATATAGTLFDSSMVHDITVTFDEADYDAMIAAYVATEDKEWIEATVTIDGVTYERVGLRLKGNSSLRGLGGGAGMGGGAGVGGPGGMGSTVSADDPASLPWLIRLDKYVKGQSHEGIESFVVRSNNSATALNEAVALELLAEAGLATQASASSRFTVNGGTAHLRLLVENPDEIWMQDELGDGALYKAESTGDYSYRGDDPDSYVDVFDQEAGEDNADLTPLIEFLQFINESDDETFAAQLDQHLDTEAFATYLAAQDLLGNFDDIDGPGNNSYLYYDTETGRMTVVTWDMNLAFGAMGGPGGGMGGFGGRGQPPADGTMPTFPDGTMPTFEGGTMPAPPAAADGTAAQDGTAATGRPTFPGGGPGGAGGMGAMNRSNVLVERFNAVPELAALVDAARQRLTASLYDSGVAQEILDRRADVLRTQAADLVDTATIDEEAAAITAQFATGD